MYSILGPYFLHRQKCKVANIIYVRVTIASNKIAYVFVYKRKRTLDCSLRNTHKQTKSRVVRGTFFCPTFSSS